MTLHHEFVSFVLPTKPRRLAHARFTPATREIECCIRIKRFDRYLLNHDGNLTLRIFIFLALLRSGCFESSVKLP